MPATISTVERAGKPNPVCQPARRVPTYAELERRRRELGVATKHLFLLAGIHETVWWDFRRGLAKTRESSIRRIEQALNDYAARRRPLRLAPALIPALARAAEEIIRRQVTSPELIIACNPKRAPRSRIPHALPAGRVRTLAIYILTVELEIENADVARALDCTRQNIKQLRDEVEDLRENRLVDRLLCDVAGLLRGTTP